MSPLPPHCPLQAAGGPQQLLQQARAAAQRGDMRAAVAAFEEAERAAPPSELPFIKADFAMTMAQAGARERAEKLFLEAVAAVPPSDVQAQLRYNLGFLLLQEWDDRREDALVQFEAAVAAAPGFGPAIMKAAWLHDQLGNADRTIELLQMALAANPRDVEVLMRLGDTLNNRKRWSEAVELYEGALKLDGRNAELRLRLGDTLTNMKRSREAARQYRLGLRSRPSHVPLLSSLGAATRDLADWEGAAERDAALQAAVGRALQRRDRAGRTPPSELQPYQTLFLEMPDALRVAVAASWATGLMAQSLAAHSGAALRSRGRFPLALGAAATQATPALGQEGAQSASSQDTQAEQSADALGVQAGQGPKARPLRIGYVSRRFEEYPGTQLMLGVFGRHDRDRVHVTAFATGPDDGSAERRSVASTSDAFVDASQMQTIDVALAIAKAEIDVLVDYDGMHDFNNAAVLALRPAPAQLTWLGFASSVGSNTLVDYAVVDAALAPVERARAAFGEPLLYLRSSYQPQDPALFREMAHVPLPASASAWWSPDVDAARAELRRREGLPPGAVVLACFNRNAKVDERAWAAWMRVLRRASRAVLWVYGRGGDAERNLRAAARAAGVDDRRRLFFAARVSKVAHLERHYAADLMLDTFVYGAHTTTADALYSGLPVLSVAGDAFAARVAVSLLRSAARGGGDAAALGALEVATRREYEDAAVRLAGSPPLLLELRRRLHALVATCAEEALDGAAAAAAAARVDGTPPLCTTRFVRGMEAAQRAAVETLAATPSADAGTVAWRAVVGGEASR